MTQEFGRILVIAGGCMVVIGLLFLLGDRIPFLGHLPGDVVYQRNGVTVIIPIATMLLLSLVLTIVLNVVARIFHE